MGGQFDIAVGGTNSLNFKGSIARIVHYNQYLTDFQIYGVLSGFRSTYGLEIY